MGLLTGKKGIITGVVNHRSIAWAIAKLFSEEGAEIGFTYANEGKWINKLAKSIDSSFIRECDVRDEEQVKNVCEEFSKEYGQIDFLVHAIAYADGNELANGVINTSKKGFLDTLEISTYSLISLCRYAQPYFAPGASVITLSYLGAERVCAGYNVMGIAKSALESTTKYLAVDLGKDKVRVNVISAGPIKTLAAYGLPNFVEMLEKRASQSPLQCNVTHEDVAKSALYFASNLSSGTTGEVVYVDAGYNIMGTWSELDAI